MMNYALCRLPEVCPDVVSQSKEDIFDLIAAEGSLFCAQILELRYLHKTAVGIIIDDEFYNITNVWILQRFWSCTPYCSHCPLKLPVYCIVKLSRIWSQVCPVLRRTLWSKILCKTFGSTFWPKILQCRFVRPGMNWKFQKTWYQKINAVELWNISILRFLSNFEVQRLNMSNYFSPRFERVCSTAQ